MLPVLFVRGRSEAGRKQFLLLLTPMPDCELANVAAFRGGRRATEDVDESVCDAAQAVLLMGQGACSR